MADTKSIKKNYQKFKNLQAKYNEDRYHDLEARENLERFHKPLTNALTETKESLSGDTSKALELLSKYNEENKAGLDEIKRLAIEDIRNPLISGLAGLEQLTELKAIEANKLNELKTSTIIGPLATKYLSMRDDSSWGLVFNPNDLKYYFGNEEVNFQGDDIIFKGYKILGSEGLWQLLTIKNPPGEIPEKSKDPKIKNNQFTFTNIGKQDMDKYLFMVEESNIHLSENGKPRSSKAFKWLIIIGPWWAKKKHENIQTPVPGTQEYFYDASDSTPINRKFNRNVALRKRPISETTGSGIKFLDPNPDVLTSRLYTLMLNLNAGHTNVDKNEILAINEKLYKENHISEDNYIEVLLLLNDK